MANRRKVKRIMVWTGVCMAAMAIFFYLEIRDIPYTPSYHYEYAFISPMHWEEMGLGIKAADKEYHTDTRCYGSNEMDAAGQIQILRKAILSKVDGIITAASENSVQFQQVIQQAADAGIPVVFVDSDMEDTTRNVYIGTNNRQAGSLAAENMIDAIEGEIYAGVIVSSLDYPQQSERAEGFKERLSRENGSEVTFVMEGYSNRLEIVERLSALLEQYPKVNALYIAEGMASGIIGNLIEQGTINQQLTVVSSDNHKDIQDYITDGIYYSSIIQNVYEQGYLAVRELTKINEGEKVEPTIVIKPYSMKKDNLLEIQTGDGDQVEWIEY